MAPSPVLERRKPRGNTYPLEVGKKGRKTGIEVPVTGPLDEHGFEPMDKLFSPDRPLDTTESLDASQVNGHEHTGNVTISVSETMEIDDSNALDPTTILTSRRQALRIPRSRSPAKTNIGSSPRKHPSFGPAMSPTRGDVVYQEDRSARRSPPVKRRLDFSKESQSRRASLMQASPGKPPRTSQVANRSTTARLSNGNAISPRPLLPPVEFEKDMEESQDILNSNVIERGEDDYQIAHLDDEETPQDSTVQEQSMLQVPNNEELEEEIQGLEGHIQDIEEAISSPTEEAKSLKRRRSLVEEDVDSSTKKKQRRRNANENGGQRDVVEPEIEPDIEPEDEPEVEPEIESGVEPEVEPEVDSREMDHEGSIVESQAVHKPGRQKKPASSGIKPSKKIGQAKRATEKQQSAQPAAKTSSPSQARRGLSVPRNDGATFILRRETPAGTFTRTRAGRNVIKPVEYWKGEAVIYDESMVEDGDQKFLLPSIKEVVRAEAVTAQNSRKGVQKGSRGPVKRRKAQPRHEEEVETSEVEEEQQMDEPWESEPGRINGIIRTWNPEDQVGVESDERDEEIALSSAAIITREIPGSKFRFAKTLTQPFFGSGMVDLPPGAVKKPKNSRKMQMVFFVHVGRVSVTVNETTFRIGKGGLWQVPRGNFYSIENDYDKPARIFFSQGCDLTELVEAPH